MLIFQVAIVYSDHIIIHLALNIFIFEATRCSTTWGGVFHFTVVPLCSGQHAGGSSLPLKLINTAIAGHAPHDGGAAKVTGFTLQCDDAFNLCVFPALISVSVYDPQVFPTQVFLWWGEEFPQAGKRSFPWWKDNWSVKLIKWNEAIVNTQEASFRH